ncbi:hypothetical protein NAEGRDRAFT_80311 [Naegleria gruberi]|uniref:Uncharacterized protein n=1 Tax=Naegleria gruberi TaxID=5762 RepID=D2VKI9_NAEGR|nr:uncharacterized protein NAEGRDRAFT_80311 [Naegleria gruberi]EFC42699.1 hypothetical protein NAEGRDRAFT_80311 [Naegleria gruberi]|eukprot:XP_002675443.1 hypothetical protein NAEGRDRAFT_80311 [Naegleria gruberi strain NEG-M]
MAQHHHSNSRETLQRLVQKFGNKNKLQFFEHDDIGSENPKNIPPLVLLIGWYGSKFRFVSKYTAIYTRKGYDVLSYIPDSWELFSKKASLNGVEKILDMIEVDQKENESSFIVHAISNNGGLFVARMMALLDSNKNDYINVRKGYRGLISDSFPGVNTEDADAISVLAGYNYDKKLKKIYYLLCILLLLSCEQYG